MKRSTVIFSVVLLGAFALFGCSGTHESRFETYMKDARTIADFAAAAQLATTDEQRMQAFGKIISEMTTPGDAETFLETLDRVYPGATENGATRTQILRLAMDKPRYFDATMAIYGMLPDSVRAVYRNRVATLVTSGNEQDMFWRAKLVLEDAERAKDGSMCADMLAVMNDHAQYPAEYADLLERAPILSLAWSRAFTQLYVKERWWDVRVVTARYNKGIEEERRFIRTLLINNAEHVSWVDIANGTERGTSLHSTAISMLRRPMPLQALIDAYGEAAGEDCQRAIVETICATAKSPEDWMVVLHRSEPRTLLGILAEEKIREYIWGEL
jgi:hypothetical protein